MDTSGRKRGGFVCTAKNCNNRSSHCNQSFFTFPKDPERFKNWAILCSRQDLLERNKPENLFKGYRVCGVHFEPKCFVDNLRKRLLPAAVPTLFAVSTNESRSDHTYCAFPLTKRFVMEVKTEIKEECIEDDQGYAESHLSASLDLGDVKNEPDEYNSGSLEKHTKIIKTFEHPCHKEKTTNPKKSYQCEICLKSFSRKGYLKEHLRNHTGEQAYECEICSSSFFHASILKTHMRIHTGEKPFQCEICFKSFTQSGAMHKHMRTHAREKPYPCEICLKSFSQKYYLKTHMKIHSGELEYQCELCSRSFFHASILKTHMRSHTREKPFQCEICFKSFSQSGAINEHMRTHTREKPYQCELCLKSFTYASTLKSHMRMHTGEKPFQCEICFKSFSQSGAMHKHLRTHSRGKPYCNKKEDLLLK